MLTAKDFRRCARETLKGRWFKAGGAAMVAGFFGASLMSGPFLLSFVEENSEKVDTNTMMSLEWILTPEFGIFITVFIGCLLAVLLWKIVQFIIGGATTLGLASYYLKMVDGETPKFKEVFSKYDRLGAGFRMQFLRGLYITLWAAVLLVPGIVASYNYSMTPYVLLDDPDLPVRKAMGKSKMLMKGNRWKLFCLEMSFLGWMLLSVVLLVMCEAAIVIPVMRNPSTLTVALAIAGFMVLIVAYVVIFYMTLVPYMNVANVVFYREIRDGKYSAVEMNAEDSRAEESVVEEETVVSEEHIVTEENIINEENFREPE